MKFAEHLGSHLTPEWRTKYVQYDDLKVFLYAATENAPMSVEVNDELLRRHFSKFDPDFFTFCDQELNKVNIFFAEKLAEAIRRYNELELEVAHTGVERLQSVATRKTFVPANDGGCDGVAVVGGGEEIATATIKPRKHKKKLQNLRVVVGEFYLSLMLIQNFQQLNFTAFRKILKKHDKMFKTTTGAEYRMSRVEMAPFYLNRNINELIENTETIAIEDLESGNRTKAMKKLRVPTLAEETKAKPAFFWGFFTGMWLVMVVCIGILSHHMNEQIPYHCGVKPSLSYSNLSNSYNTTELPPVLSGNVTRSLRTLPGRQQQKWEPVIRMYRGYLSLLIMIGLLGINIHGWRQAGVNHVLIFELDPRHNLSSAEFLMVASFLGVLWSISCLAFLLAEEKMAAYAQPVAFALFLLIFLLNPTKCLWYRTRRWFLRILFRIFRAPFCAVRFADFWLADQMNSMVMAIRDFEFLVCFYAFELSHADTEDCVCTDPKVNFDYFRVIVALLPAWFRFAQCWRRYYDTRKFFPHLVNAGKYFSSIMVTVLSTLATLLEAKNDFTQPLHIAWVVCWFVSTLYSLTWDLRMDWGLFAKNAGENFLLREQIVYPHKVYYYLAILMDVILRFLKPLTVTIGVPESFNHEALSFVLGIGEIFRRFIWNFFRLENEHLNNCGEFRSVRDISIKPINIFDDDEPHRQTRLAEGKEKLSIEQIMDSETGPLPKRKVVQMLLASEGNSFNVDRRTSVPHTGVSREPNFSGTPGTGTPVNRSKKSVRKLSSITII